MVALATNPITWVIAGIGGIATVAYQCSRAIKDVREKANELNDTFSTSKTEIEDYKTQIKDLQETINDSSSSIEDVTTARQNLMSIQDELIDKFGDEKETIDLITDAINGQSDALDTLTQKQWQAAKNEFNDGGFWNNVANFIDGYSDNIDRMLNEYGNYGATIDLSKYGGTLLTEGYEEFKQMLLNDFGAKISDIGSEYIELSGNASEAYQQLLEIQTILEENSSYKPDDSFSNYLGELATSANDVSEQYKNFYNQYVLYEKIFKDSTYEKSFKNITDAYSDYREAFATGNEDSIKKAQENFASILTQATEGVSDESVVDYFNNMYPELQEVVGDWQFEVNFTANTDGLKDSVSGYLAKLDGLYEYDLQNFNYDTATDEQKKAYDGLLSVARLYGLTIDQLIEKMVQMGLVQNEEYQKLVNQFGKENIDKIAPEDLEIAYKIENVGNMTFEEFTAKIKEMKEEAAKTNSDTPAYSSFTEAWKSLSNITDSDSPLKDLKENLLELASAGQLTEKTFNQTEGAKTWMKQLEGLGLAVDDVIEKINKLKSVSSADQLSSMKTGISSISSILGQKKENLSEKETKSMGIGADTLAGMPEEVKKCTKAYNKFCEVLGNGKSSMSQCREAANKLATAYVNSNNFLANLTEKNADYYKSVLSEMGVENADAIVTNELAKQKGIAAIETADLTNMTAEEINKLIEEKGKTDEARNAMKLFALEKIYANGNGLDTSSDVEQLANLVESLGIAAEGLRAYQSALNNYNPARAMDDAVLDYQKNKALEDLKNARKKLKNKTKLKATSGITVDVPKSTSDKSSSSDKTKSTQIIDWIERRIDAINSKIDLFGAKLQNALSVTKKNKFLDKEIKQLTKLINVYGKAEKKYSQKAKSVKLSKNKKISENLKKLVRNGAIDKSYKELIKTYGEETANKIEQYKEWYDKAQNAKKSKEEARATKREKQIEKHQNKADYAQSQIDKLQAQSDNVPLNNVTKKNSLLKSQLKYIKQSYAQQIKIAKLECDSVKAATLLAQKNAEILQIKKDILQNSLDSSEEKRALSDAKYNNAQTVEEKNAILDERLATYSSDKKAYNNYYDDVKSSLGLGSAKSKVTSIFAAPSKVLGLTKSDVDKIKTLMKQNKKIPNTILKKVTHPTLLNRLKEYNNKIAELEAAGYIRDLGLEQIETDEREDKIEQHQIKADDAEARYNLNQQLENNAVYAKDKNRYETLSRDNLKEQYAELVEIAKLNGDVTEEKRLQAELEEKLNESYKKEFDNIKAEYDNKTGRIDSEVGVTQAEISALEAQGKKVSTAFYDAMIKAEQDKKAELLAERNELEEKLSTLAVGSADWYDAKNTLDGISTALYECTQNTAEWQKTINELNMKPFENLLSNLQASESRIEFLINMLSHNELIDDDTGALTSDGLATLSLQLDEIANKTKQINNLREEWSKFDFSNLSEEEIIEKNKEFQESIQSLIEGMGDLKDSIIDLCENALNAQLNALNDLISKYKDALNAEEDLYQYQKKIKEQTETIASLMKQQAALQGDKSEEARARLQQIEVKLKDARENLEETEHQRTLDDINDMLDRLSEDFEDYISSI
ncbi:MAG: hypothetical protein NC397_10410, partial [Clostridium sp.]|nr:hypothetical protein [Clostridium sp.]